MASSSALCCVTSSATAATSMRVAASVPSSSFASRSSSVSFSLGAPPALMGLRISSSSSSLSFSGRRRVHLEQGFRRLSIRAAEANADADAGAAVVPEGGGTDHVDASGPTTGPVAVTPPTLPRKKSRVSVKPAKKQRVILRFLWLEKTIGMSLDQVVPGYGVLPLSPYYFWPRKDAWEELKAKLVSKRWISQKRTIILLNQATDIINLWQQKM